ncbi:AraC family transcriptional regulator [Lacrimispora sp.]|uniref:AraC family transcriptional regulator n=1 Tax=Lacrimispora sp. TaxID=2719234 RepID=UPI00289AE64E|nr:AraC family transcriptional regulator [Lacrimispora sp.]
MHNILDEMYGDFLVCQLKSQVSVLNAYHRHDGYEVYLLVNGEADYYVNTECYRLTEGSMILMNPGEYHKAALVDKSKYQRTVLNISTCRLRSLSSELTSLEACFVNTGESGARIRMLEKSDISGFVMQIRKLEQLLLAEGVYGKDLLVNSMLSAIFVEINNYYRQRDTLQTRNIINPIVCEIISYVDNHYTGCISLADLSKHVSYNGTYLSRLFKQTMGISLSEYIMQRRIDMAKHLIDNGSPLTKACMDAGFCDYANFSRSFKAQQGCSPKKYQSRQKVR